MINGEFLPKKKSPFSYIVKLIYSEIFVRYFERKGLSKTPRVLGCCAELIR